MKKCPTCDKEFADSMRFCQSDGTPLVDVVESAPPEDPYKTTVARSEDIASIIPPEDPFKTVVGNAPRSDDSGDLLQLPEEHDPLKTAYVPEAQLRQELNLDPPKEEAIELDPGFPPLPSPDDFVGQETPKVEEAPPPIFSAPEPPKFSEPSLSPPPLDWSSSAMESNKAAIEEKVPTFEETPPPIEPDYSEPPTLISEPFKLDPPAPPKFEPPTKIETSNDSPFGSPLNTPIPSPFDDSKPASYQAPSTPLPSFKEPEPIVEEPANNPFAPTPFGQSNDPFNQPVKQNDWTPPPAPEASWQNQEIGQNTPFQPPVVAGEDKTLAIVSLVSGILGLVCCGALAGVVALITGYMAKNNADSNPSVYGGRGMAVAGMIMGAISIVLTIIVVILQIFLGVLGNL